jgi:hypothetical protein
MLNVVCLKHGTKYGPEYVNKLYNMIQRHLTIPNNFICFTDDPTNIDQNIKIVNLPKLPIEGWWWKPYIFKTGHFPDGDDILYIDLDMVIVDNINKLIEFEPNKFVGLQDVGRVFRPGYKKLGSAVMRWKANEHSGIWNNLEKNLTQTKKFHGDQDWIWEQAKHHLVFFPEQWIRSYKWEIRTRDELSGFGKTSVFKEVRNPKIPIDCSILAFHGYPHLHTVQDPVILENWR